MSSLVPSVSYIHPLPVCNWPWLTDTCPVLTYSISGARVPLGQTVTPDSAKWQSNAAHRANHWNLLALLQLPRLEPLKNRVCAQKERCAMMWFIWMDEEAAGCKDERVCVCVCASRLVWNVSRGVQGSLGVHGECRSFSHSPPSHPSCAHLTSRFCLAAMSWGTRLDVSESVTLVLSHLRRGTGGWTRRHGATETRRRRGRAEGQLVVGVLFHRLFLFHRLSNLSTSCQFYVLFLYYIHSTRWP